MELSFERLPEKRRSGCTLPSFFYNKLHLLFASIQEDALFIPVRKLQYLAIVDAEEVIFVDGRRSRYIDIAWQNFRPHERNAIDDPVAFELVVYEALEDEFVAQLQSEFFKAVAEYEARHGHPDGPGTVIPLKPGR